MCCVQLCTCCLVNVLPVCSGKGQTKIMLTGVQAVCQSLCYAPQMNETTGTCTVTFSGSNFSHVHAMLLGCCADSVLSVEKLSKAVPFLRCPLMTGLMIMEQNP